MYCPNCGSNNQPDVSFCTRCGTSLTLVSDALAGKVATPAQLDERTAALVRRYYAGRHKMLLGAGSLIAGVALSAILLMSGQWSWLFWVFLWALLGLFGYGARNFTRGWHQWSRSSIELKALGYRLPASGAPHLAQKDASQLTAPAARIAALPQVDSSAAVPPASITEHTTRHLDSKQTK